MPTLPLRRELDPDADEARRWIIDELSKPQYEAAKPTWWDRLVSAFLEWLGSLSFGGGATQSALLLIAFLVVVALVVAVVILFGRPRRRTRTAVTGALFGRDETRTAHELRRAAEAAASRADWATAIEERYRAIARALEERTIVRTSPGTTAHGFASLAASAFPDHADTLRDAADAFDDVRYLEHPGTEDAYRVIERLDRDLDTARAILPSVGTEVTA